jgi:hypothetical protein
MGIRDFFMSDEERAKKRQERIKAAQAAKKDNDRKNDIVRMMTSKMFEYGEQCVLIAGCALDDDKTHMEFSKNGIMVINPHFSMYISIKKYTFRKIFP